MSDDFLDSNIFIYLFDKSDPRKQAIAGRLVNSALTSNAGAISFQVVQETLNVATGKLKTVMLPQDVLQFLEQVLSPLWRIMPSRPLYHHALRLRQQHQFSFYDGLIVAAALEAGCERLLSEDLQHGQRIESLVIENPFRDSST